jgi:hypothetical protein
VQKCVKYYENLFQKKLEFFLTKHDFFVLEIYIYIYRKIITHEQKVDEQQVALHFKLFVSY